MENIIRSSLPIAMIYCFALAGCSDGSGQQGTGWQSKRAGVNEVIVHNLSDPDRLNPVTSQGASSTYIKNDIFMYLLDIDKEKLELVPSLAQAMPVITELTEGEFAGGLSIVYEIRPEAVWDNGEPVTAYDVEFTLKAIKNPLVDCENLRPYLDFINHIEIDKENPKKFTMYCKEKYFAAEASSGYQAFIAPEYVYDPKGLMKKFALKDLSDPLKKDALRGNPDMIAFANEFNSEKYQREVGSVVGCGPYEFAGWTTGQRIILKRKPNWWGHQLAGKAVNFEALPEKITHEIINDRTTALSAMKDEGLDISIYLREKDFSDLTNDANFTRMYHLFKPQALSYTYIGINMKHPVLSDLRVRKALAHAVDRQQIIDVLTYGLAEPINGPFHPTKKYYNHDMKGYDFNVEASKALLEEAGWTDTDGDGIRDKIIDGKKEKLSFTIKYNSGNDTREKVALFFKESTKKLGVELEILAKEWTVYLEETKNHQFDLYVLGWIQNPTEDDPKQLWHTDSYNKGSNNVGFGNEETDALIESIRKEMDEEKRTQLYLKFQEIVESEVPYIFLFTPKERVIMSKRFENAKAYIARPGYTERELIVSGSRAMAEN